jgi:hypothetical protein
MNKLLLGFLYSPVLLSSLLTVGVFLNKAQAVEPDIKTTDRLSCIRNKHKVGLVCARASVLAQIPAYEAEKTPASTPNDVPMLEFNVEESDVAIALFGCDCPACINSLRQMRGVTPLVY